MECPKCSSQQADDNTICSDCGIVFSKYYLYHPRPDDMQQEASRQQQQQDSADELHVPGIDVTGPTLKQRLFHIQDNEDLISVSFRGLVLLGMLVLSFKLITSTIASNYVGEIFLHNINLPFHEAGHVIFRPLGSFMTSLGGTLGQLLVPAICCYAFLFRHLNPFAAAVCFWWTGENFLDIAPYINDARAGDLPLLGGNFGHSSPYGFHDWEYLLTESGLLRQDHAIASLSFFIGSVMMISALAWGGLLLYRQYRVAVSH